MHGPGILKIVKETIDNGVEIYDIYIGEWENNQLVMLYEH